MGKRIGEIAIGSWFAMKILVLGFYKSPSVIKQYGIGVGAWQAPWVGPGGWKGWKKLS